YSLCVPNQTTNTIFSRYSISTINRYAFPCILNTTLLFVNTEACLYWDFSSLGLFQLAAVASSYHANNDCSAGGNSHQYSFNVFTAITRIGKYTKKLPKWLQIY